MYSSYASSSHFNQMPAQPTKKSDLIDNSKFSYYSEESTGGDAVWKPTRPPLN